MQGGDTSVRLCGWGAIYCNGCNQSNKFVGMLRKCVKITPLSTLPDKYRAIAVPVKFYLPINQIVWRNFACVTNVWIAVPVFWIKLVSQVFVVLEVSPQNFEPVLHVCLKPQADSNMGRVGYVWPPCIERYCLYRIPPWKPPHFREVAFSRGAFRKGAFSNGLLKCFQIVPNT